MVGQERITTHLWCWKLGLFGNNYCFKAFKVSVYKLQEVKDLWSNLTIVQIRICEEFWCCLLQEFQLKFWSKFWSEFWSEKQSEYMQNNSNQNPGNIKWAWDNYFEIWFCTISINQKFVKKWHEQLINFTSASPIADNRFTTIILLKKGFSFCSAIWPNLPGQVNFSKFKTRFYL